MPFIWFWTFWHWSTESYRTGALLRGPIHGVGGHWDEWFRHEASVEDRRAIETTGASPRRQRQFVAWLVRHWAPSAEWHGQRAPARFVLAQLADLAPFDRWPAFARYRAGFGTGGVSAVVLAEHSVGDASDVRAVEAVLVPPDPAADAPTVVPHGFSVDGAELSSARQAVLGMLRGRGLVRLLLLWVATGRRPHRPALGAALGAGWVGVCALMLGLAVGPDPGDRLPLVAATLVIGWSTLTFTAFTMSVVVALQAWRVGRLLGGRLDGRQLRLRMEGGMTLIGGSAGAAFSLNTLRALHRDAPRASTHSWLWRQVLSTLRVNATAWAATGVIAPDGRIRPVILEPKVRACLRHPEVAHLITPRQDGATSTATTRPADLPPEGWTAADLRGRGLPPNVRLGFASGRPSLRSHPCGHLAQALMTLGGLTSRRQAAMNGVAMAASAAMLVALPDLRGILLPPAAPTPTRAASTSPDVVRVVLHTRHPRQFAVLMTSGFWSNRRVDLVSDGSTDTTAYAELRLTRSADQTTRDVLDGTVWVERRRRFLTREFTPGERVGQYSLTYFSGARD
jgi:hypothetical protein